jgi:hypothetical protein
MNHGHSAAQHSSDQRYVHQIRHATMSVPNRLLSPPQLRLRLSGATLMAAAAPAAQLTSQDAVTAPDHAMKLCVMCRT